MRRRSERQNLRDLRKGRREAFEATICEHYKSIYRFVAHLSGDASLAEDLTQETFVSAWANISGYKGRASLGTWLHKIAYNKFIDSGRMLDRRAALIAGLKKDGPDILEVSDPFYRLIKDEHSLLLYESMHRLDSAEYLVIVLHYVQGFSFRDMAIVLDESVGTVKWRTSQALKRLRAFLTGRI